MRGIVHTFNAFIFVSSRQIDEEEGEEGTKENAEVDDHPLPIVPLINDGTVDGSADAPASNGCASMHHIVEQQDADSHDEDRTSRCSIPLRRRGRRGSIYRWDNRESVGR